MSRIDEALRLARGESTAAVATPAESVPRPDSLNQYPRDTGARLPRRESDDPAAVARALRVGPGGQVRRPLRDRLTHLGPKVVTDQGASRTLIEEFRRFATMLTQQHVPQHGLVMISSAMADEGKTMTATNLALTLAGSFKEQVLLIDADLRRPSLQTVFGVEGPGLTEWIDATEPSSPNVTQLSDTLAFLSAGRPAEDPFAVLNSSSMKQLLQHVSTEFKWVIVDTPPVGVVPDARVIGNVADLIILVMRAQSTPYTAVESAIEELGRTRICGIVLNQAEASSQNREYGAYAYVGRPSA